MITITDPPTLVKAAEPTAEPTAEIKHPTTHIDIYETMLSPFAVAAHAQCVASRLRALGWAPQISLSQGLAGVMADWGRDA